MDFHPLFVHFPIALLTIYAVLEIARKWLHGERWDAAREVLVIAGAVLAGITLATGETAKHLFADRSMRPVIELHATVAVAATWVFAVLAACYLLASPHYSSQVMRLPAGLQKALAPLSLFAERIVRLPFLAPLLALVGFLLLGLTGALGGILVYGPEFDPVTSAVYHYFF